MHDIKWIREHPDAFDRGAGAARACGRNRRSCSRIDEKRPRRDPEGRGGAGAAQRGLEGDRRGEEEQGRGAAQALMAEVAAAQGHDPGTGSGGEEALGTELDDVLAAIPNLPLDEVPDGKDETDNVEHHHFGAKRNYAFAPKQHFELGEALGHMDFETAAKLSGARFVVLKSGLARMERALGQFMLDLHTNEHGYTEVAPPLLVRDEVMFGTAQLPKFADDQFWAVKGELLAGERPVDRRACARSGLAHPHRRSPAHQSRPRIHRRRSRAAAARSPPHAVLPRRGGRGRQGHARHDPPAPVHQGRAGLDHHAGAESKDEHERMLSCAEEVLRRLELHYRVVTLCTGDMGFASQKTYDIEVWLPGQGTYREISSCSICGDFQARRMDARFRGQGEPHAALRAHAQRLRRRGRPRADRRDGELPAGGRQRSRCRMCCGPIWAGRR